MNYHKNIFQLLILLYSVLYYTQSYKGDSLTGEFTYRLRAKFDKRTDNRYEELFTLQVGNRRAFFASAISLKGDSVMENSRVTTKNYDGSITLSYKDNAVIPKTNFNFTVIQTNENVQYFDSAAMSLLTYKQPVISNWELADETRIINTITCKKAKVKFKGRNWIAWYAPEIPLPYGPMKFSGLPGLIIKITDEKEDFDFELVKSLSVSQLKGKFINIKKSRYTGAIETTQAKLKQAQKTADENAAAVLASYGTTIIKGQEMLKQREKAREENEKYKNPLELSE
ncbi:GLPGLI family protein [Chryseobacterium shandongense]|uniref:GLPGLI family protein n=1 Tax=Chryseobacterium shandongense TaxID=1493872 RepID=A0AAD1DKM8_9FLAO|nr:GLPGLI family protein [Chryseobacterium shandongense]AZA86402.1 GLPGLI family protein [Chryseobacterium shandongense]AZA94812.1 GLPGLI family protein [Chryseobacterium shandongense]